MSQRTSPEQSPPLKLAQDAAIAMGLGAALLVVFGIDALRPKPPQNAVVPPIEVHEVEQTEEVVPEPKPLRLAVTTPEYDDMGKLLDTLGSGYQYKTITIEQLLDPESFKDLDVLFLTCGTVPESWCEAELGDAERPGTRSVKLKPEVSERRGKNLRDFVEKGGTLYASDLQMGAIIDGFREFVDPTLLHSGKKQKVEAQAVDQGLAQVIGPKLELEFDMPGWYSAGFRPDKSQVLVRGTFETSQSEQVEAPLLVRFSVGQGNVIFTSFHNEKVNSQIEQALLRYLVFTSVMAKTEAKVTSTLVAGGFSPTSRSLLSTSKDSPEVRQTYHCKQAGPLKFALGFEERGAKLKLSVVGPKGEKFEQEGTSSFTIDVPDATVGDWQYTVTALRVPFENFPFNLSIAEKSK